MLSKKYSGIRLPAILMGLCLVVTTGLWLAGSHRNRKDSRPANAGQQVAEDGKRPVRDVAELRKRGGSANVGDYPVLMKQLLQVKDPGAQQEMIASLMLRWLEADPKSFGVYLDEVMIGEEQVWNRLAPGMMAALRKLDPEIAKSYQILHLAERVIVKGAETAPHDSLAWAREWLTGTNLDSALSAIAAELANIDPETAIAVVSDIKALSNRMEACAGIGMVLGAQNSDLGLSWAASFTLEAEQAYALSGVLSGMADRDSSRASAEYLKAVEAMKTKYRDRVIADRAASGTTVEEEYEGLSAEEILKAELARPNPNLIYLEKAAYIIGTTLARDNPRMALDWAKSLDIYQGQVVAMEAVFGEWATTSPQEAYHSYLQESDRRPELAERIFTAWASTDATAASEAAFSLDTGLERDSAVEGVARGWIDSGASPEQLAAWSDQLANPSEKDRVLAIVASESAIENPVFAWDQLQQMRNTAKRSELFYEVFPSLAENNPKVARRALASIGLSRVETEYFESMLGN